MWILGEGLGTDMGEFWDRHWRSYYCRRLGGLGQRLGMLTFGGGGVVCVRGVWGQISGMLILWGQGLGDRD